MYCDLIKIFFFFRFVRLENNEESTKMEFDASDFFTDFSTNNYWTDFGPYSCRGWQKKMQGTIYIYILI